MDARTRVICDRAVISPVYSMTLSHASLMADKQIQAGDSCTSVGAFCGRDIKYTTTSLPATHRPISRSEWTAPSCPVIIALYFQSTLNRVFATLDSGFASPVGRTSTSRSSPLSRYLLLPVIAGCGDLHTLEDQTRKYIFRLRRVAGVNPRHHPVVRSRSVHHGLPRPHIPDSRERYGYCTSP
jgi:hypothetical protein